MPVREPTDEKLCRKNDKAIGLRAKVALLVVRPPREQGLLDENPPSPSMHVSGTGVGGHKSGSAPRFSPRAQVGLVEPSRP